MSPDVTVKEAPAGGVRDDIVASGTGASPPRSRVVRLIRYLAVLAGSIQLGLQLFIGIPVAWNNRETRRDVYQLYTHARMVRSGAPLYWSWSGYGPDVMTEARPKYGLQRMPYPPFLTPALSYLAGQPYMVFERVWSLLLLAGFWVYAACLARLAVGRFDAPGVLGAGAILALMPGAYFAFGIGNVEPLLWALLGLSLVSLRLRGCGFAGIALVKLWGIWPLAAAFAREGRRVLLGALAVLTLALGSSIAALGPTRFLGASVDWARYMLPVVGQGTFNSGNLSLAAGGLRLLRHLGWNYVGGPLPGWARSYMLVLGVGAPLATAWLARRHSVALQTALISSAAVAFGPICWTSYVSLLLAPVAVAAGEALQKERSGVHRPRGDGN